MSGAGQTVANMILSAASQLTAAQFDTYQRLCKRLLHGPQFQLILLDCRDERLQQQLQQQLSSLCQQAKIAATTLVLDDQIPDVFALQQQLKTLAVQHGVIQLAGAAFWFSQQNRWASFNLLRENIAEDVKSRLLFWLNEESIRAMIEQAPDWWAWRGGVYEFSADNSKSAEQPELQLSHLSSVHLHKDKSARRIATLSEWLKSSAASDPELASPLWFELAILYQRQGEWDLALDIYQSRCLPQFRQLKHERSEAMTLGQIAEIFMLKGQLEHALQIRQQEIDIYTKLGLSLDIATTQGKIADICYRRGELDRALAIWQHDVLPVFKKLGEQRGAAIITAKIADVFIAREQPDEALEILREVLRDFSQAGDTHSFAITQGKIAEILLQRGALTAALQLVQEQELPTYQKLGDSHSACIAKANIANILAAQHKFDEALELLQREVLPELERFDDLYSLAAAHRKIAEIQLASGNSALALETYQTKVLPLLVRLNNQPYIVDTEQQIASIRQSLHQVATFPHD